MNDFKPKTELLYQKSKPIDQLNLIDGIHLMIDEQKKAAIEVKKVALEIEAAVNVIYKHLILNTRGRLIMAMYRSNPSAQPLPGYNTAPLTKQVATESLVLLENKNRTLPLKVKTAAAGAVAKLKIAVVGPFADCQSCYYGADL